VSSKFLAGLVTFLVPLPVLASQKTDVPPGTPVTIIVKPAEPATPPVSIVLKGRHGHVTPHREGCCHTGAGYIEVQQPTADTVIVTMTGIAVAVGSPRGPGVATVEFDLDQCFDVSFDKEGLKAAKISIEGRVIGLLRSECKGGGSAEESNGCASILCDTNELLSLRAPSHSVAGGENLAVNCHEGPVEAPIVAGKYRLHQIFHIGAYHPRAYLPCKAASAEFAPDPALDPLWISYWEPFHGTTKKDFGLQITIKVAEDTSAPGVPEPPKEKLPEPKPDDKKPDSKPAPTPGAIKF
jgi:hypothetical protein